MPSHDQPKGLLFAPQFPEDDEQARLLDRLRSLGYHHDTFRGRRLKRGSAQFGYMYVATGRKLELAAPMPDFLEQLIVKAQPHYSQGTRLNPCIVAWYPPGAGIGWHTDAPQFKDCTLGISLASTARFQFRRTGTETIEFELAATPGSLYRMQSPARWEYSIMSFLSQRSVTL